MKLVQWFKENVLKKEKHIYTVHYIYNKDKIVKLTEEARSKSDARKQASKFIKNNATPGKNYKFLKVERWK